MKDFLEAFKVGIKAATEVSRSHKEVDKVFAEADRAIEEASGGQVGIARVGNGFSFKHDEIRASMAGSCQGELKEISGMVVLLSKVQQVAPVKVADWCQASRGFVFSIRFERREIIAKSVVQLRTALSELLASPVVGGAFLSIMNATPCGDAEKDARHDAPVIKSAKSKAKRKGVPGGKPGASGPAQ